MKKLILILSFVLISANSFASSSSRKYSEDTNPAYKGMLGCFDYLMETRNQNTDKEVVETKNKMNRALENGVKNPACREMLICAYEQEITELEYNRKEFGEKEYSERLVVLKNLGKKLGLK